MTDPRAVWPPERTDTLRRMWAAGVPLSGIAAALGISVPAVSKAARRYGLPSRLPMVEHRRRADDAAAYYARIYRWLINNGHAPDAARIGAERATRAQRP